MWGRRVSGIFILGAALSGVPAMSVARTAPIGHCLVIDGGKLLASSGGADLLCSAVSRAVEKQAPGVQYTAEIKVISPSRLATALVVNGHALPLQNFAVMDRNLTPLTIQRFADSIAFAVVQATKRGQR